MSAIKRTQARPGAVGPDGATPEPTLVWPGDSQGLEPENIDFEAVAYVLANTCRWGGRSRQFFSLAQHAVVASEEIEALAELDERDRRALALHGLLANARAEGEGVAPGSAMTAPTARSRRRRPGSIRYCPTNGPRSCASYFA